MKNCDFFLIFAKRIDRGFTEAVLTSTHDLCFRAKIRTKCIPQFYYIKVECKRVSNTRTCYPDVSTVNITQTRTCHFDQFKHHFYIVKFWCTGVYVIFRIFTLNIDCG